MERYISRDHGYKHAARYAYIINPEDICHHISCHILSACFNIRPVCSLVASSSREKPIMAITLSYAMTGLSFDTLLVRSFEPVHIFGGVVFIGITAAYIAALGAWYRRE